MVLVVLIIEILILGYIDFRIFGTIYTPVIVMAIPFLGVVILNLLWGTSSGMVPLYLPALWVWVIGFLIFWLAGFIMSCVLIKKTNVVQNPFKLLNIFDSKLMLFFQVFSFSLIVPMYYKLIDAFNKYIPGSDVFSDTLSGGIAAHASIWLIVPIIFFLIISKFTKRYLINWLLILLWIVFAFSYNSKTWILIPGIAGLIGRLVISKAKVSFKKAAILIASGILLFFVSYSISFGYWAPWIFVKNHFIYYTNAGLLSFSEYIRLKKDVGISTEFLFEPFFNVYYKFSGHKVISIISDLKILVDKIHSPNVKTFFGAIYIYGGVIGGLFTSFVWGGLCYFFLILNVICKNVVLFIVYLFLLSGLFFGWFDIYFNNLGFYEVVVEGLLLFVMTTILLKKGKIELKKFKS